MLHVPRLVERGAELTSTFERVNYGKVRHEVIELQHRVTRTRVNGCKLLEFGASGAPSGSGESWFEPRRGNWRRDRSLAPVAFLRFLGREVSSGVSFSPLPLMMIVMMLQESGRETARRVAEESSRWRVAHHREQRLFVGFQIAAHERGHIIPATAAAGVCGSGVGDRGVRAFFLGCPLLIPSSQRRRVGLPRH